MDWIIIDKDGNFLQEANCQYDCCDLSVMFHNAKKIELDFNKQEARIIETNNDK